MRKSTPGFRRSRRLMTQAGLLAFPTLLAARAPTPSQTAGPFYPEEPPRERDHDLTRVAGATRPANGEITDLSGRVLDLDGHSLAGLRVEIWQCDANGRYRHPRDRQAVEADPGFQGFGHATTDAAGRYRFRTIRPVAYPGRTPHIHAAIFGDSGPPFVTQVYVQGEPQNDEDFLFRRVDATLRPLLLVELVAAEQTDVTWNAAFDFILASPLADPRRDAYPFG